MTNLLWIVNTPVLTESKKLISIIRMGRHSEFGPRRIKFSKKGGTFIRLMDMNAFRGDGFDVKRRGRG